MYKLEKCPICKGEKWHDLDYLRDQSYWYERDRREEGEPVGFKVCKTCGFVTYDYMEESRLDEFYKMDRPAVLSGNIVTCNRKNSYHRKFLAESPEFQALAKKDGATFIDIGCAQGPFLKFIADEYFISPNNLYGTEVNDALVAWAVGEYGLKNVECPNITTYERKYDFVCYYHSLEHLQDPDRELAQVRDCLVDDGLLYISIPYWFKEFQIFDGTLLNDYEQLYHVNHVNVFTIQSFLNLLGQAGFEIIQEDWNLYGYTVMCRKSERRDMVFENWEDIVKRLETEKQAVDLVRQSRHEEAIALIPEYADAHMMLSLNTQNMRDFEKQKEILGRGIEQCGETYRLIAQLAKMYFQWDGNKPDTKPFYSNNIKMSEKLFRQAHDMRPGNEEVLYFLSLIESKYKGNQAEAARLMSEVHKINPGRWTECLNMIGSFWKSKTLKA